MGLNCGIVGLPNVGKSTIFSALTSAPAEAANYPFCTINPNIGIVSVPDRRLDKITALIPTDKSISATVEFVDIAGLVAGASKGEGLGNRFLASIREVRSEERRVGKSVELGGRRIMKKEREISKHSRSYL